jgi:hypothetical protein
MATINISTEFIDGAEGYESFQGIKRVNTIELEVDFADKDLFPNGVAAAGADVVQVFDLPRGICYDSAVIYIEPGDESGATGDDIDVGFASTVSIIADDRLVDGADCTTAGYKGGGANVAYPIVAEGLTSIVLSNNNIAAVVDGKINILVSVTNYFSQAENNHPGVSTG